MQTDHHQYALEAIRVTKEFGSFRALDDVTVRVERGQFVTILGHSGSGKTTLLRLISGLELPTRAAGLRIGGEDALAIPPHRRNVTTIFQQFALFPHMSVGENIEYGLKLKGIDPATRTRRAKEMLELVQLPGIYDKRVHQLSGGERQRVALARSIVVEPEILLLDEAISALDEGLRAAMQVELASLQRRLGMTFIYITHSQEEALTMSDRIVLLQRGKVAQEGSPSDLFERPNSRVSALFMGVENVLSGSVVGHGADGRVLIAVDGHTFSGQWTGTGNAELGDAVCGFIRAEKVHVASRLPGNAFTIPGQLHERVYKGKHIDSVVETALGKVTLRGSEDLPTGDLTIGWDTADLKVAPVK